MIRDTKDELISYIDENVKIINSIDDDDGDNSKGIAMLVQKLVVVIVLVETRVKNDVLNQNDYKHINNMYKNNNNNNVMIEMTRKLYHHIDTVESKVENGS